MTEKFIIAKIDIQNNVHASKAGLYEDLYYIINNYYLKKKKKKKKSKTAGTLLHTLPPIVEVWVHCAFPHTAREPKSSS